jgi:hypothetical protein
VRVQTRGVGFALAASYTLGCEKDFALSLDPPYPTAVDGMAVDALPQPPPPSAVAAEAEALQVDGGDETESPARRPWTAGAAVTAVVGLGLGVAVLAFTAPFIIVPWLPRKLFGALPFYATSPRRVANLLAALPPAYTAPGRRFVDLGSGDGVAVIAAAKRGMVGTGACAGGGLRAAAAASLAVSCPCATTLPRPLKQHNNTPLLSLAQAWS